jgi:hypothetical protein
MNKEEIRKELEEMNLLNPMNSIYYKMRDLVALKTYKEYMKNNNKNNNNNNK